MPVKWRDQIDDVDHIPVKVASYKIRNLIGKGGMGAVYHAEQANPHRPVALKLIRADKMSRRTLRRFATESEILGRLHHPGIAHVYEAGTAATASGEQPYFAMELIDGERLDEYVRRHGLGVLARLELMIKIAAALEHAHQNGVIHLDLKPSNIMVDRSGQPKILDFGIARVIGEELPDGTSHTHVSALAGTLPYMSPEQTVSDLRECDARSDVYTLGVITYELLAERLPYDIAGHSLIDAVRIVREESPMRLGRISRHLAGDIEVVVGKALEKEADRRYQSASEFADELNCIVKALPIRAAPPTIWSDLRHWTLREERIRQAGLAATAMCVVGGIFESFWALVGIAVLLGLLPLRLPGIRWYDFTRDCVFWALVLGVMARLNWGVMQRRVLSMWFALVFSVSIFALIVLVINDLFPFDMGGAVAERGTRLALFSFFAPFVLVIGLFNGTALIAFYVRRQWEKPNPSVLRK